MKINLILLAFFLLFVNIFENVKGKEGSILDDIITGIGEVANKTVPVLTHIFNEVAVRLGIDTTKYGAIALDMVKDENGIYHANFNCWQQYFGYNKLYDFMFDLGTSMQYHNDGIFTYNGINYIFWAWKGDYINLGAGSELGLYRNGNGKDSHWEAAPESALPMTLTITHKTLGTIVKNYSSTTWWITAFNPKYKNVYATDLTTTYTVRFIDAGMYTAFEKTKSPGWTFNSAKKTATLVL